MGQGHGKPQKQKRRQRHQRRKKNVQRKAAETSPSLIAAKEVNAKEDPEVVLEVPPPVQTTEDQKQEVKPSSPVAGSSTVTSGLNETVGESTVSGTKEETNEDREAIETETVTPSKASTWLKAFVEKRRSGESGARAEGTANGSQIDDTKSGTSAENAETETNEVPKCEY